jgi:hypothetical protein
MRKKTFRKIDKIRRSRKRRAGTKPTQVGTWQTNGNTIYLPHAQAAAMAAKKQGTKQQQQPSVMDTMPPQIEQRRDIIQGSELPDGRGLKGKESIPNLSQSQIGLQDLPDGQEIHDEGLVSNESVTPWNQTVFVVLSIGNHTIPIIVQIPEKEKLNDEIYYLSNSINWKHVDSKLIEVIYNGIKNDERLVYSTPVKRFSLMYIIDYLLKQKLLNASLSEQDLNVPKKRSFFSRFTRKGGV